jgi:hypothetical protein
LILCYVRFEKFFWKITVTAFPCLGYTGYTQPITHPLISGSAAPAAPEPVPGWAGFTPAPLYQPQQQVDPANLLNYGELNGSIMCVTTIQ